MAITQISKITHRKGLTEDLPQLDVGELGWAYDQRRLFIGNNPDLAFSRVHPEFGVDVTEILTTESSLLDLANSYQYQGDAAGYVHNTAPRSLTAKLDEYVSVKDYGAVGDGIADDTVAIQEALTDLYTRQLTAQTRRILFFPAGRYVVTGTIVLPSHAYLAGEGRNSSLIEFVGTSSLVSHVIQANLGTTGIVLRQLGVSTDTAIPVVSFAGVNGALLDDVALRGPGRPTLVAPASDATLLAISGVTSGFNAVTASENIYIRRCLFADADHAAVFEDGVRNVVIDQSEVDNVRYGIRASSVSHVRTTLSQFSNIISFGQWFDSSSTFNTSHFNSYINVADGLVEPIISFLGAGNVSVGDMFDRAIDIGPRVSLNNAASIAFENAERVRLGSYTREVGITETLQTNASNLPVIVLPLPAYNTFSVDYTIRRVSSSGPAVRTGRLRVAAQFTNPPQWDEEYSEDVDAGVEFFITVVGTEISINYTLVNNAAGDGGTLTYSITKLT